MAAISGKYSEKRHEQDRGKKLVEKVEVSCFGRDSLGTILKKKKISLNNPDSIYVE